MKYDVTECVIILAADEGYMDYARAVFSNCLRQGEWGGSFALIVPKGTDGSDFARRGIFVQEADSTDPFYQKYTIFSPYFRRWRVALYVDCDVLVQALLEPLLEEVQENRIVADREEFTLEHCFNYWKAERNAELGKAGLPVPQEQRELLERLLDTYGRAYRQYNTALLLFRPADYPMDAMQRTITMHESIKPINTHVLRGTDQPVINLTFYEHLWDVRHKFFSYWAHATDQTKIVHYCSGHAPWLEMEDPGMGGYMNTKLGRPCNDVYKENLLAFNDLFPIRE
jgi:hypothetical protein